MQLPELMREELYGLVTRLGLLTVESLLRQDVEALCGPRYSRSQETRPSRGGTTAGSLALGGRRVEVRRPQVRHGGHEVPLDTWEQPSSEDPLQRRLLATRSPDGRGDALPATAQADTRGE